MIYLLLVFSTFCSWAQEQPSAEPAKSMKNALSISGGTAFSTARFFNPSFDIKYSRNIWRNFGLSVGFKYLNYTLDKVEYSTGEYKYNTSWDYIFFIGLNGDFPVSERWSMCASVILGKCLLGYDYYYFFDGQCRSALIFSCAAKYAINSHWNVFCEYSYNIPGRDIYWSVISSYPEQQNLCFEELKAGNEFNCHDLKFGISFRF